MRPILPLIALALTSAAAAEPLPHDVSPQQALPAPDARQPGESGVVPCRDSIHMVRAERGLPRLQRETASPDEPLMIAAVDHRIDGCAVMVMYHDTADVRPLPSPGTAEFQRIPRR